MSDKDQLFYRILNIFNNMPNICVKIAQYDSNCFSLEFYDKHKYDNDSDTEAKIEFYYGTTSLEELINIVLFGNRVSCSIFHAMKNLIRFKYSGYNPTQKFKMELANTRIAHILAQFDNCKNIDEINLELDLMGV